MMSRTAGARAGGFTLIELLVALFITAIIFSVGYGGIDQALRNHAQLKEHQARLTEVQNAVRVMVQDFSELAARPIRDQLGQNWLASISSQTSDTSSSSSTSTTAAAPDTQEDDTEPLGDDGNPDLVAFTRAGWANPAGIQRSTLERVSYRFANGTLRRMHWTVLDGTEASQPVRRDLLTHVKSVAFRFMNDQREWVNQWPALGDSSLRSRPFAVEITLELQDWGHIVRVIEVPS
ncbi:MAG TPA: type II secretion system minor pseudopilin GspJ [Steroidobacteraceae bacterium]|jgi:general secretion pathway protein J|nr:type II secretion system minor pseudopilin GspJ [Steroidobacteraceae bacterium]